MSCNVIMQWCIEDFRWESFFKPITEQQKWVFYSLRKDIMFYNEKMLWFYTYTCIPQRFKRTVGKYNRNVMLNAFLWFNVGSAHILVFPKGSKELCVCNAIILYQLFSCDVMFESMRILEFPKGSDDLYAHKTET
jgi:hypothetical protein